MRNFVITVNGKMYQVGVEEVGATAPVVMPVAPVAAAPVAAPAPAPVAAPAPAPKQDDAAIAAAIAAAMAAAEDNGALVAAITAAITAARAENGESGSFRVVSFKRVERKHGFRR
jgi:glutaconyl-CoA decarboxylase